MTNLLFGMPQGAEWLIILFVVLLIFGSTRLPLLARGMGKSIREFKKGVGEGEDDDAIDAARREQLKAGEPARASVDEVAADRVAPGDRR